MMLRRKNARGKGPPTEAVLKHAGAGPNRRPSPRTRHRATTKTPRPASRVSSPKSPKFTDSLLEGTRFELSSRCRSSGLPQGGSGGPSCRIPAKDSWRTPAAAPSPNDIRSALAKTQHKMAPLRPSFACTWDQGFESLFLQRRVRDELGNRAFEPGLRPIAWRQGAT